jgi:hypothetical protein
MPFIEHGLFVVFFTDTFCNIRTCDLGSCGMKLHFLSRAYLHEQFDMPLLCYPIEITIVLALPELWSSIGNLSAHRRAVGTASENCMNLNEYLLEPSTALGTTFSTH